ncbi:hypothetical protein EXN66_Car009370 [Channa argus]|uniref:Uncharacterized protein n=1 Tax=Channa argus TaxID=215402 RepID=A0A6G1PU75_CHAAH|nr:hypothetical protein EXN66_Car009370 [Channa argus]
MAYTHIHHTQVFILACTDKLSQSLWHDGTHACSGKHTDAQKLIHTLCPRASVHSLRAPNC